MFVQCETNKNSVMCCR